MYIHMYVQSNRIIIINTVATYIHIEIIVYVQRTAVFKMTKSKLKDKKNNTNVEY